MSTTADTGTATDEAHQHDDEVRLEVPAHHRYLRMARLTASGYATDMGFTIDEIEELRLAVDEACAVLIEHAPEDAQLTITYRRQDGLLTIDARCTTHAALPLELDPVARAVLHTTVDAFELLPGADGTTAFRLRKRGAVTST